MTYTHIIPPVPVSPFTFGWEEQLASVWVEVHSVGDLPEGWGDFTDDEKIHWCAREAHDRLHLEPVSDRDRLIEQLDYSGWRDRLSLDPFAYDRHGNDTGLRESDFI